MPSSTPNSAAISIQRGHASQKVMIPVQIVLTVSGVIWRGATPPQVSRLGVVSKPIEYAPMAKNAT